MPDHPNVPYPGVMDAPNHETTTDEQRAAAGFTSTPEGRAEARRKLAESRAKWTPERFDALRAQLGLHRHTA